MPVVQARISIMSNRTTLSTTHTFTTGTVASFTVAPSASTYTETTSGTASPISATVLCNNTCKSVEPQSSWTNSFIQRLRRSSTQALPARSRRPSRRSSTDDKINEIDDTKITISRENSTGFFTDNSPIRSTSSTFFHYTTDSKSSNCISSKNLSKVAIKAIRSPASQLVRVVTQASGGTTAFAYIAALFILSTICSLCAASPCDNHSWWDPLKDKCIECTVCQGELIPLRPCQLHRDTICGSIYDLKIDWVVLAKTEPNWKERRKDGDSLNLEHQLTHEELQQLQDDSLPLDWQTTALFLAVLACLLFFMVAAGILVHHMRQWRRMERRLDQDVEELSTKLMAKLAEVQSLEGGTFFIGNAEALHVPTTFQPQHVLLPEKPAKYHERRILKTLQPGNVYIEESSSKG